MNNDPGKEISQKDQEETKKQFDELNRNYNYMLEEIKILKEQSEKHENALIDAGIYDEAKIKNSI